MLSVLSGLPADRKKDKNVIEAFSKSHGLKIICGTSTMRAYCEILNIEPETIIDYNAGLPEARYKIEGVRLACEGIITLNDCLKILSGKNVENKNAGILSDMLKKENEINFIIGTAKNGDSDFYKSKKLLSRKETLKKISELLPAGKKITLSEV